MSAVPSRALTSLQLSPNSGHICNRSQAPIFDDKENISLKQVPGNLSIKVSKKPQSSLRSRSVEVKPLTSEASCSTDIAGDRFVTRDSTEDVVHMLTSYQPNPRYFELVAEERRKALEIALQENERLCEENEKLRLEQDKLVALVAEGQEYADLLARIMEEPDLDV